MIWKLMGGVSSAAVSGLFETTRLHPLGLPMNYRNYMELLLFMKCIQARTCPDPTA